MAAPPMANAIAEPACVPACGMVPSIAKTLSRVSSLLNVRWARERECVCVRERERERDKKMVLKLLRQLQSC